MTQSITSANQVMMDLFFFYSPQAQKQITFFISNIWGFKKPHGENSNTCLCGNLSIRFGNHQKADWNGPLWGNITPDDWWYLQTFSKTTVQSECSQHEWPHNCNWWNEVLTNLISLHDCYFWQHWKGQLRKCIQSTLFYFSLFLRNIINITYQHRLYITTYWEKRGNYMYQTLCT